MTRPLVWYDGQEGGVDELELWDLLRRHGFVEGVLQVQDADTQRRIDELAAELFEEIQASLGERAHQELERAIAEEAELQAEADEENGAEPAQEASSV